MDQLDRLAALREADRPQAVRDEAGEQARGVAERARADAELGVDQLRVPERDRPLGRGRGVAVDHGGRLAEQRLRQLRGVRDRRRGEHELRLRAVRAGQPAQAPEDVRDVRPEDAAVDVRLVDDDEAEVREHVAPAVVVRQHADVEHVRVGQDDVRPLADLPAPLALGVAVVDRRLDPLQAERLQRAGLILRERLRRVEVERAALRLAREQVEHGQVEREALAARRARRDDRVAAGAERLPRLGLVAVERGDPLRDERRRDARVEVVRKRLALPGSRRLDGEVRELLADQDLLPGWCDRRHDAYASLRRTGVPSSGLRSHPSNLIRLGPAKGAESIPRALTIATSDSGGGAGIQADLKAFAAAGVYGTSALVALTAQSTTAVTAVHELPPDFIRAQLDAIFDDIGVDAAKTGMLFSRTIIETVAEFLERHPVPLVVDPVLIASSGAQLLQDDAVETLIQRLFPLATVVTPNLPEAETLTGLPGASRRELAERLVELGAAAALVTGGHGDPAVDHLFDGHEHVELPVERHAVAATHGAGCTHSATLAALLARGLPLVEAARGASAAASAAVRNGLVEIGAGDGPVDVLNVKGGA